jgi:hypothetical protein
MTDQWSKGWGEAQTTGCGTTVMTDFQAGFLVVLVLAIWFGIALLGALHGFCGDADAVASDDEDDFTIFSDITDPAKSYLIGNIYYDDGGD